MRRSVAIRIGMRSAEVALREVGCAATASWPASPHGFALFSRALRRPVMSEGCIREELRSGFAGGAKHMRFIPEITCCVQSPNKAPEPTPMAVTIRADARLAPATVVAHL
jgi:hypothetical protein